MKSSETLIKVDIDGVLRNWNASLIKQYKLRYPGHTVIYPFETFGLAKNFPDCVDLRAFYGEDAAWEIYTKAEPYEGAMNFLDTLNARYPNVWFVTTQYAHTMYPTIDWIERNVHGEENVPVIFSANKGRVGITKYRHTILIDDAPHNLDSQVDAGGLAICFGQLYNFSSPSYNKPGHNQWYNIFGDTDFSLENESQRIATQYEMILKYLSRIIDR